MQDTWIRRAAVAATLALACQFVHADAGRTPGGFWYSVGGIGDEDSARIAADSVNHAFSLRLAARGSGAWLPDVDLRIVDARNRRVFEGHLDGLWLLIDLPPGRYEVVGEYEGEVSRLDVVVPVRGRRSAVMYFPVDGLAHRFQEGPP